MPGQPRTAALKAHLLEEVEGQSRAEIVFDLWSGGVTQEEIAKTITVVYEGANWTPNRRTLFDLLRRDWPAEYKAALIGFAESCGEDQLTVLKNAPETKEGIAKAREVAASLRWLASKRDPASFGDTPATAIQINNPGQLFLQAVARPGALPPPKKSGDANGVGTVPQDETKEDGA